VAVTDAARRSDPQRNKNIKMIRSNRKKFLVPGRHPGISSAGLKSPGWALGPRAQEAKLV
jgi:hypothetical protein